MTKEELKNKIEKPKNYSSSKLLVIITEEQRQYLSVKKAQGFGMAEIVRDLLDWAIANDESYAEEEKQNDNN